MMQFITPFLAVLSVGLATATPLEKRSDGSSSEGSMGAQIFKTQNGNWSTWNGGWTMVGHDGNAWNAVPSDGGKVINNARYFNNSVKASVDIVLSPVDPATPNTDAGLIIFGLNPGLGADKYDGYYGAISYDRGILIGKADAQGSEGQWQQLINDDAVKPEPGLKYTLTFEASKGTLTATAHNESSTFSTTIENDSFTEGYSGLRVYKVGASFTKYSSETE